MIAMCLATPAKVLEIDGETAKIEVDGIRRDANISLLDDVKVGDYVLVHAGFALHLWPADEMKDLIVVPTGRKERNGEET